MAGVAEPDVEHPVLCHDAAIGDGERGVGPDDVIPQEREQADGRGKERYDPVAEQAGDVGDDDRHAQDQRRHAHPILGRRHEQQEDGQDGPDRDIGVHRADRAIVQRQHEAKDKGQDEQYQGLDEVHYG